VDALLAPLPGDSPAGESLLFSDVYDKIQVARRGSDRALFEGEGKPADWRLVARLASEALTTRSKDLQIGVWLLDALTRLHGFPGLRDGLRILCGLHDRFWEGMHPVVEDGDLATRANRLSWLNEAGEGRGSLAAAIADIPITDPAGSAGFGWGQWKESREVEKLARQSAERHERALAEGRLTVEQFDQAVTASSRRFYEGLFADLQAAFDECSRLETVAGERYGRDAPSLLNVHSAIEECRDVVERIVAEKRRLEPDPEEVAVDNSDGIPQATSAGRSGPLPLEPVNRADAVRRLEAVAAFFRRTEPHSPVAYLVQRAVRWAEMPLDQWLKDVIASDDVLSRIRDTLGLKGE
jgi:type VI secretion system protein ImpA